MAGLFADAEGSCLAEVRGLTLGRRVDDVGFLAADDIGTVPVAESYDRLLSEFPSWISTAGRAGVL